MTLCNFNPYNCFTRNLHTLLDMHMCSLSHSIGTQIFIIIIDKNVCGTEWCMVWPFFQNHVTCKHMILVDCIFVILKITFCILPSKEYSSIWLFCLPVLMETNFTHNSTVTMETLCDVINCCIMLLCLRLLLLCLCGVYQCG